jgi:hypothetical protein
MLKVRQKIPSPADENFTRPRRQPDQRQETRIISHVPLIFSIFSSKFQREYASMTFNHSRKGMCIEAAAPFKPGSVFYIRLGNATSDQVYHRNRKYLRTSTLATVMWCREQRDSFGTFYRLGLRYF